MNNELCNNKQENVQESQTHYQKIIGKHSTEPPQNLDRQKKSERENQEENPNEWERRQTNTCPAAMSVKYYNSTCADWLW